MRHPQGIQPRTITVMNVLNRGLLTAILHQDSRDYLSELQSWPAVRCHYTSVESPLDGSHRWTQHNLGGGAPFNLRGGAGFRGWTKLFFHHDPADIYSFPAAWSSNYLFHFRIYLFQLSLEGNYLFQQLAATKLFISPASCLKLFISIRCLPPSLEMNGPPLKEIRTCRA